MLYNSDTSLPNNILVLTLVAQHQSEYPKHRKDYDNLATFRGCKFVASLRHLFIPLEEYISSIYLLWIIYFFNYYLVFVTTSDQNLSIYYFDFFKNMRHP